MKTILVVENQAVVLQLLVDFLQKLGHKVIAAEDGLAALEVLKEVRPDLVFTDLVMPNINGEKLCQTIRSRDDLKHIPIIIYSSTVLEDEKAVCGFGADVCLAKGPFAETRTHILRILEHIDNGTLYELKGKHLGGDALYKRQATAELLSLIRHYETIFNNLPDGLLEFTMDGKIFRANNAALALCGLREEELLASSFFTLFHEENQQRIHTLLHNPDLTSQIIDEAAPVLLNDKMITIRFLPSRDETHNFIAAIMHDITQLKNMEERLRKSALTDELTGLFNRRGFMVLAEKLLEINERDKADLLLIYLDVDNLKWINDTLGHIAGDQAIVETATLLKETFRLADVISRLGGDEFVILCADNPALDNEETMLKRLHDNIKKINNMPNRQYPLSLSAGMSHYEHLHPCTIDELLNRADQAMYENKKNKKAQRQEAYTH